MRALLGIAIMVVTITAEAQLWSLPEAACEASLEFLDIYTKGGDTAAIKAINSCHAGITDKTAFNLATARCFTMDMMGSLLGNYRMEVLGEKDVPGFYIDKGGFFGRGMSYLLLVPREQLDPVVQTISNCILEVMPELKPPSPR